jgi:hypothetical protein
VRCACAQEVPLESCKTLATIEAAGDQRRLKFLVDTGTTSSLLNTNSFPEGTTVHAVMHSWAETFSADGRTARVDDLTVGRDAVRDFFSILDLQYKRTLNLPNSFDNLEM